jgi:inhibitor of cysteine peptidase
MRPMVLITIKDLDLGVDEIKSTGVLIGLGDVLTIRLESNPTTGYSWEASFDEEYVRFMGEDYQRTSMAIGGGGIVELTFLALKEGKTMITMRLKRPWEDDTIKILNYDVKINGRPSSLKPNLMS